MLSVLVFSMSLMMLLVDPYLRQGKQKELTCVCVLFFLPDLTPPDKLSLMLRDLQQAFSFLPCHCGWTGHMNHIMGNQEHDSNKKMPMPGLGYMDQTD